VGRRTALKAVGATLGAAAFAKRPGTPHRMGPEHLRLEFLQKHYKELGREELAAILARLEAETPNATAPTSRSPTFHPEDDVQFAYALNLSICIGCRKCAEACHKENNHDRPSQTVLHPRA
jgi:ferredoxin